MTPTRLFYDFGHFRLDTAEETLLCMGKPVHLTPKALAVLRILVTKAGHVVGKEQLMQQCWPGIFVEDANLAENIHLIRRALYDGYGEDEYIQTVHRRGYRFVAAVRVHDNARLDRPAEASGNGSLEADSSSKQPQSNLDWAKNKPLEKRGTESDEAHHLYLRGRYYWNKYTVEALNKGISCFRQAIALDRNYALACAGLAGCHYRLSDMHLPPKRAMPRAKAILLKALKLDGTAAEAHALLGLIRMFYDRSRSEAEAAFKRAIALAPKCALVHQRYGLHLGLLGRFDEAITEMKLAAGIDPRSPQVQIELGMIFHLARRYEEAVEQAQQALDIDPDGYRARVLLGMALVQQGEFGAACGELQCAAALADLPWTLGYLGYACGVSGKQRQATKILMKLAERAKEAYVSPYAMALIHAGLGQKEEALRSLDKMYEDRGEMTAFARISPEFDGLRADQRFAALLRGNGLTAKSTGPRLKLAIA